MITHYTRHLLVQWLLFGLCNESKPPEIFKQQVKQQLRRCIQKKEAQTVGKTGRNAAERRLFRGVSCM